MVEIGNKIKEARLAKKLTQKALAEKLNVTPQTVSKWELEKSWPDLAMVQQLCIHLDLNPDDLLGSPTQKPSFLETLLAKVRPKRAAKQPQPELPQAVTTVMFFDITTMDNNYTPQTLLLVTKMNQAAKKRKIPVDIQMWSASKVEEKAPLADVILLTPVFAYAKEEILEKFPDKKVRRVDMQAYGLLNGDQVLLEALED